MDVISDPLKRSEWRPGTAEGINGLLEGVPGRRVESVRGCSLSSLLETVSFIVSSSRAETGKWVGGGGGKGVLDPELGQKCCSKSKLVLTQLGLTGQ